MKHRVIRAVILAAVLAVDCSYVAFAAATPAPTDDHTSIFMAIIGGLCTILFTIACYQLGKVDKNQAELYRLQKEDRERIIKLETRSEDCPNCP